METTFEIPVHKIYEVSRHLQKLQKRAKKAGQGVVFTFAYDDEIRSRRFDAQTEEGDNLVVSYNYRVLRVNQDITIHEGWTPIAKLDVVEKQMKAYNTYNKEIESLGDSLWTKHCDHCGHNKIVHTAFVMQNGDKFMKVGKGCMKDLAPVSAAQIAKEFDIYALWSSYLNLMAKPEFVGADGSFKGRGGSGVSVDYVYDKSILILAMRAALEVTDGKWVTSQYSEYERGERQEITNKGRRTFDFIQSFLSKDRCMIPDAEYVASVNADVNLCLEKYSVSLSEEKLLALRTFAAADKARAIDIFIIKTVQDIILREAEKEKMKVSQYQGTVGTKLSLTVQLVTTRHGQGAFGEWTLWIFRDANGNMFKKFGRVGDKFKVEGEGAYQFTAPVKAFELYEDIKYTVLGGPLSKFKA